MPPVCRLGFSDHIAAGPVNIDAADSRPETLFCYMFVAGAEAGRVLLEPAEPREVGW